MSTNASPASFTFRPYRSHKHPACSFCRNRKTRCDVDASGPPCRLCREKGWTCNLGGSSVASSQTPSAEDPRTSDARRPSKRTRHAADMHGERSSTATQRAGPSSSSGFPSVISTSPTESSLMMNPQMAEDITVLQQYLTSKAKEPPLPSRVYNTVSTVFGSGPIVYLPVPKRRRGLRHAKDPGKAQREIIENVLGSLAYEVRETFFAHLHPCFPVLDKDTFRSMWRDNSDRISPALVCDIYASALQVWHRPPCLRDLERPDPHFIWNQAVIALQDDFMAPTIATVHAAVLDLLGRPVIGVTGNIANAGRIVTLAQSLGLHRDPSTWEATSHEKKVRINLWWGVLIHDYWSSVGHGIPPTISPQCYDVPLPTFPLEADAKSPYETMEFQSNATFLLLCRLSQILGDLLPLVYSLQTKPDEILRRLRKIESVLDDWSDACAQKLQANRGSPGFINGASNVGFAHLSLRLLVCRIYYKAVLEQVEAAAEARAYRFVMLRDAALKAAHYITALVDDELKEFWMPYTSYLLVTTATILLRCTIESKEVEDQKTCVMQLVAFRDRLQRARIELEWDLADFCCERCTIPIQNVADAIGLPAGHRTSTTAYDQTNAPLIEDAEWDPIDLSYASDLFLPIDSLDYPWETLWDGIQGPRPIQI